MPDIIGTSDPDTLEGTSDPDDIEGLGGNDVITGGGGDDDIDGGAGADSIRGGADADWIQGNDGDDSLYGDGGNDNLVDSYNGGFGSDNDLLDGGAGNDTLASYQHAGFDDRDTMLGGTGDDVLVLNGGQTGDQVDGGSGTDLFVGNMDAGGLSFVVQFSTSSFTISQAGVAQAFIANCEMLRWYSGTGSDSIVGGALGDEIVSTGGADTLIGGAGNDRIGMQSFGGVNSPVNLSGNDGTDTFYWFNGRAQTADAFVIDVDAGLFTRNGVSIGTISGFEVVEFTAFEEAVQADRIVGGVFADTISAGGGDDSVSGGEGDDTIYGNHGRDSIAGGGGDDTLDTGPSAALASGVIEADTVSGGSGDDLIYVRPYIDGWSTTYGTSAAGSRWDGGSGEDTLWLVGSGGLDLSGATVRGIEVLRGSDFTSTLAISLRAAQVADIRDFDFGQVLALTTGGSVSINGLLRASAVRLSNSATEFDFSAAVAPVGSIAAFSVTGGTAADTITGGDRGDRIAGGDGADSLLGGAGNDTLYGTAFFIDGSGDDTMNGGAGDDTYYVDSTGDVVRETRNGGIDHVNAGGFGSDGAYTMAANLESMSISSVSGLVGPFLATGNNSANTITGNGFSAEQIRGGGGADTLDGGIGSGIDSVDYSDKRDAVVLTLAAGLQATVTVGGVAEDLIRNFRNVIGGRGDDRITGDLNANVLEGGNGADRLGGGLGADTLVGQAGADRLTGNGDADVFLYRAVSDSATATGVDLIVDLRAGDLIDLSAIDARAGGGDNAFTFVDTPQGGLAKLYVVYDAVDDVSTVYGNVDGGPPDLVITVNGQVGEDAFVL